MRKRFWTALTVLVLTGCEAAPVAKPGMTASYTIDYRPAAMVVKVADDGDYFLVKKGNGRLRRDGVDYSFLSAADRTVTARTADFEALSAERKAQRESDSETRLSAEPERMGQPLKDGQIIDLPGGHKLRFRAPKPPRYALVRDGSETIAGIPGERWSVREIDAAKPRTLDLVISPDPALKPIRAGLDKLLGGPATENVERADSFNARLNEALAKGLVLRFSTIYKLEKIDRAPIPVTAFASPGIELDARGLREFDLNPRAFPAK